MRPSYAETRPCRSKLHLTARVEKVFLDRSRQLPADVQLLLRLVAADETGQAAVISAAAAQLGLGMDLLEPAVKLGLLLADTESVAMRHPLVRSAIYQAATEEDRRIGATPRYWSAVGRG